jgi:hypothetical protein
VAVITSLESYWELEEASGDALDAHGSNTLTDTNTVASAVGKVGNCRDFESANSEYFTITDNASVSVGNIDFTFCAWVNAETLASYPCILSKVEPSAASVEYNLFYNIDVSRFRFYVSSDGGTGGTLTFVDANNFGAASTGVWYFIVAKHDSVNNQISIKVNEGTADTAAHTTGVFDGGNAFKIGSSLPGIPLGYWDGLIDQVGFWKKVTTDAEDTWLYNSGNGRSYAAIVAEAAPPVYPPSTTPKFRDRTNLRPAPYRPGLPR